MCASGKFDLKKTMDETSALRDVLQSIFSVKYSLFWINDLHIFVVYAKLK